MLRTTDSLVNKKQKPTTANSGLPITTSKLANYYCFLRHNNLRSFDEAFFILLYHYSTSLGKCQGNFVKKFQAGELCVETQKILAVKEREFGYVDGKCGERILSDIKNGIIEAENPRIKVVFFGASFICDHYLKKLDIMNNIHFEVIALSDNNMEKWGAARNGIAVIPPEKLKYISFDILVITSEQYYLPIKKKLVYELYIEEEKVLRLDRFVEKYFESREEE